MDASEKMKTHYAGALAVGTGLCLVVAVSLGARGCFQRDYRQEVACRNAGGNFVSPTSAASKGCYRMKLEFESIVVPDSVGR